MNHNWLRRYLVVPAIPYKNGSRRCYEGNLICYKCFFMCIYIAQYYEYSSLYGIITNVYIAKEVSHSKFQKLLVSTYSYCQLEVSAVGT